MAEAKETRLGGTRHQPGKTPPPADKKPAGGGNDLFLWIDALWNKKQLEGTFPAYVAHRFLASDRDMAQYARELQLRVREPNLIFKIWQGVLPKGRGAPKLQYVAAKKPPAAEALIAKIQQVNSERRDVVEAMVGIVAESGLLSDLYWEYGIEEPKA